MKEKYGNLTKEEAKQKKEEMIQHLKEKFDIE